MKRILLVICMAALAMGCKKKEEFQQAPQVTAVQGTITHYSMPSGATDIWVTCVDGVKVFVGNNSFQIVTENNQMVKCQ